jgi:hypothetical protein
MSRTQPVGLLGLLVLYLFAAGITVAAYYSFIIPEFRGEEFYAGVIASCIAELVFFGYLAYTIGGRTTADQPASPVRLRLMVLVTIWVLAIIVMSAIAAEPNNTDTLFADKIILFQLIVTFFFAAAVFFQHRQAVAVQVRDAAPQQERCRIESYAGGLDVLLGGVKEVALQHPDHAVGLDALAKRIDTLRTQLRSVSPAMDRGTDRPVSPADTALIEEQLGVLHDEVTSLTSAGAEAIEEKIRKTRAAADRALATLRQREDALTF